MNKEKRFVCCFCGKSMGDGYEVILTSNERDSTDFKIFFSHKKCFKKDLKE